MKLALIVAKAKEAGRKAGMKAERKKCEPKKKKATKISQALAGAGFKIPETEEERIALCSVNKNGDEILRMMDPAFFIKILLRQQQNSS